MKADVRVASRGPASMAKNTLFALPTVPRTSPLLDIRYQRSTTTYLYRGLSRTVSQTARKSHPVTSKATHRPAPGTLDHLLGRRPGLDSISSRSYTSGPNPSSHRSAQRATWALIGVNTLVFGAWQYAQQTQNRPLLTTLHRHATLSLANYHAGRHWTLLTAAFSHRDLGHFAFNMFALHAFGSVLALVPGVGAVHVLGAALGSAVAGSAAWLWREGEQRRAAVAAVAAVGRRKGDNGGGWGGWKAFSSGSRTVAAPREAVGLGASGMVMGLGAIATGLMPFAPMSLFLIPIPIPLWLITTGYVLLDTYYLDSQVSRVGHAAHLGGFAFGALYYVARLRRQGGIWQMVRRGLRR